MTYVTQSLLQLADKDEISNRCPGVQYPTISGAIILRVPMGPWYSSWVPKGATTTLHSQMNTKILDDPCFGEMNLILGRLVIMVILSYSYNVLIFGYDIVLILHHPAWRQIRADIGLKFKMSISLVFRITNLKYIYTSIWKIEFCENKHNMWKLSL